MFVFTSNILQLESDVAVALKLNIYIHLVFLKSIHEWD